MSYIPADTAILNEVALRLGNITTSNGYNNKLNKISRARSVAFTGHDLPAANYYHGSVVSTKTKYGKNNKIQFLIIEVHSKTRDEPFIDVADSLANDIVTGLFRSTSAPTVTDTPDITLGGTVQSITYTGHDPFIGQGQEPFCGSVVRFEVSYLNDLGDMIDYS